MARKRGKQYEADSLWFKSALNAKVKCSCGHSIIMSSRIDGMICTHCGKYVPNKRKNFKETLKQMLEGNDEDVKNKR